MDEFLPPCADAVIAAFMAWRFKGDLNMKKTLIVIVNAIIMAAILVFVVSYSRLESRDAYQRQIDYFVDTTVTIEHVTENYLEGEQNICDVWARYINSEEMTMQEVVDYIRPSHVLANTSAHLIALDTLAGLSTRPKQGTADDYAISYDGLGLLEDVSWIAEIGKAINVTRAFTNPMNGLDATRAIRAMEEPWRASIPIVAMTADAFSENITECLNAGMNGHIAKPVDIKLVIKEIRRIKEERGQA